MCGCGLWTMFVDDVCALCVLCVCVCACAGVRVRVCGCGAPRLVLRRWAGPMRRSAPMAKAKPQGTWVSPAAGSSGGPAVGIRYESVRQGVSLRGCRPGARLRGLALGKPAWAGGSHGPYRLGGPGVLTDHTAWVDPRVPGADREWWTRMFPGPTASGSVWNVFRTLMGLGSRST